jgi:PWI domain
MTKTSAMKLKIDAHSPKGRELQNVVKEKLREYLGAEYNDDVLPLYIVVMLQHGNNEALITENLQAFLGESHSAHFSSW